MTSVFELLYTSAAATLEGPGYGVVAKTRGLNTALEQHMKALSRYDFLSAGPGQGEDIFAVTRCGDWHVFSRILDAGSDYTNRRVFFAHHVAVPTGELGSLSPFELIRSPQLFRDRWNEEPRLLAPRTLGRMGLENRVGGEWSSATLGRLDEAGWLRFVRGKKLPAFLVSSDADTNLRLFCESGMSLPAKQQQETTFISAMNADFGEIRLDWIGLIRGTKLQITASAKAAPRLLDLDDPRQIEALTDSTASSAAGSGISALPRGPAVTSEYGDIDWGQDAVSQTYRRQAGTSRIQPTSFGDSELPPVPVEPTKTLNWFPWIGGPLIVLLLIACGAGIKRLKDMEKSTADLDARLVAQTEELSIARTQLEQQKKKLSPPGDLSTVDRRAEKIPESSELLELRSQVEKLTAREQALQQDLKNLKKLLGLNDDAPLSAAVSRIEEIARALDDTLKPLEAERSAEDNTQKRSQPQTDLYNRVTSGRKRIGDVVDANEQLRESLSMYREDPPEFRKVLSGLVELNEELHAKTQPYTVCTTAKSIKNCEFLGLSQLRLDDVPGDQPNRKTVRRLDDKTAVADIAWQNKQIELEIPEFLGAERRTPDALTLLRCIGLKVTYDDDSMQFVTLSRLQSPILVNQDVVLRNLNSVDDQKDQQMSALQGFCSSLDTLTTKLQWTVRIHSVRLRALRAPVVYRPEKPLAFTLSEASPLNPDGQKMPDFPLSAKLNIVNKEKVRTKMEFVLQGTDDETKRLAADLNQCTEVSATVWIGSGEEAYPVLKFGRPEVPENQGGQPRHE